MNSNVQSKPLGEKPRTPISTATKNKLSVFQFGGQSTSDRTAKHSMVSQSSNDEKENQVAQRELPAAAEPAGATADTAKSPESALPKILNKDIPSTPAGRLALPDLIGMGDVRRAVQDVSPEDRIEWDQHSSNLLISVKAKKRARSSSPTSSPAAKTPSRFNTKGEHLHPLLDPGSELWGRYSLNGSTPQVGAIPALANLMHTSSPQVSKERTTPRTTPAFRRANSCGNQFPKRRRIGGPDEDVFTESVNLGPSKLSVLIERVHEGLAQPKQLQTEVRNSDSSSASGEIVSAHDQNYTPLQQDMANDNRGIEMYAVGESQIQPNNTENHLNVLRSDISGHGEFDDDELDDIALLDAIAQPHELSTPVDLASTRIGSLPNNSANSSGCSDFTGVKVTENEFDDSDEDLFAADIEDMVAKFDIQHTGANGTFVNHCQTGTEALKTDSGDEFGDGGFDDVDFEIAEAAATQSRQHSSSSLLPVRTKFP